MASDRQYVLVTGTNSGLGLGICTRLIDDFLASQPSTASLTLIFTTRSTKKGNDTLKIIQAHVKHKHSASTKSDRIHLQAENVELTNLISVHALATKLNRSAIPKLDAAIFNAGVAGWSGLDWFTAVPDVLRDMRTSTTWPRFKLGIAGLLTNEQFPSETQTSLEPPLGQLFCANVFGHYMLAHWLMPLFQACDPTKPGRIIWVSSIEPRRHHLDEDDIQSLKSHSAYEGTKRLADVLALTYDRPSTASIVSSYTTPSEEMDSASQPQRPARSKPTMHTVHPGVLATTIIALYWIVHQAYYLAIWFARLIGAPWSTLDAYPAAMSMTWLALAPQAEIKEEEAKFGSPGARVKWGTAASRFGTVSVKPTDVDGWGINGNGEAFADRWWAGTLGRAPGATDAKREDVEEFVAQGVRVWKYMESLRRDWEERIARYHKSQGTRS